MRKAKPICREEIDEPRFWAKVAVAGPNECWLWQAGRSSIKSGYGTFNVRVRGTSHFKAHLAHRVAFALGYGDIAGDTHVLHHCDNPPCVNPLHLWLGSHGDNMRDASAKGRSRNPNCQPGEKGPNARLTNSAARAIRVQSAAGATQSSLARSFGVSRATIALVVQNKTFKIAEAGYANV